jgi:hypothetical protein
MAHTSDTVALEWGVSEARRRIHDDDLEGLRKLLAEYPALLSWRSDEDAGGLLGMATGSYGDSFDASREQIFTRAACAELLIDAGAVVEPAVCDGLIESRTRGLLDLFHHKGVLPRTLKFLAALGDVEGIRARLDTTGDDLEAVNQSFTCACHFEHGTAAELLLDRSIALDAGLGTRIDGGPGRSAFVRYIMENSLTFTNAEPAGLWQAYVMRRVVRAVHDDDLAAFVDGLRREAWMLADAHVKFQAGLIERAVLRDRPAFITALLDLDPAVLRSRVPPPSKAIEFAFAYAKTHLLPALLRIWPLPDDLPHAAGNGDFARVKRWFDAAGETSEQQVLDIALAWAVINNHFEIADFLLAHGADINTKWSSHEPASILHELAHFHKNYEAMQFLIDRGIDMTIADYRWGATAQGWAYYAAQDEKMAQWLAEAQKRRELHGRC